MPLRTADIQAFLLAIELGGISAAARHMGLSKSVVSKRISDLERELGVSLLQRSTRRIMPSESGRYFYEQARSAMNQLDHAAQSLSDSSRELCGELRILGPMSFGTRWLSPLIARFAKAHPRLHLILELDDRLVDTGYERYDVVLRITRLGDSALIARKLATSRRVLCCSPEYAEQAGLPQTVDELVRHACLGYSNSTPGQVWAFREDGPDAVVKTIAPRGGVFTANNGEILRDAALAGSGLAVLPRFIVWEDLQAGRLLEVQPGATPLDDGIFAVYPRSAFSSAKLRSLVQFLQTSLAPQPWEVPDAVPAVADIAPLFAQAGAAR
ncbi:LysR family transcriptional regulator [Cupriavidus necator]|uniref:LysR family transcriptional regulator n=1 Tax=Cupriavidus necator TaxID=106590 RepID=A0A1U9UZV6_CUPNE|nr:LysR family transcriptional regulator [Cupriavidus necator]AQV98220.1 LysR family transcriptional regulator [Cupriavidus necator]